MDASQLTNTMLGLFASKELLGKIKSKHTSVFFASSPNSKLIALIRAMRFVFMAKLEKAVLNTWYADKRADDLDHMDIIFDGLLIDYWERRA
jgi:hypothetical protein